MLDISHNPVSKESLANLADMMENNRTLEYLGLAKCKFENEDISTIFSQIGRMPFPSD